MTQATDAIMSHPINEDAARESVISGSFSALDGEDLEDYSDAEDENGPLGLQCLPHLSRRVRCGHPLTGTSKSCPRQCHTLTDSSSAPQTHKILVLLLTFLCYTAFHASRKPLSIVKSVLTGEGAINSIAAVITAQDWQPLTAGASSLVAFAHALSACMSLCHGLVADVRLFTSSFFAQCRRLGRPPEAPPPPQAPQEASQEASPPPRPATSAGAALSAAAR
jgi:hypothetical protein